MSREKVHIELRFVFIMALFSLKFAHSGGKCQDQQLKEKNLINNLKRTNFLVRLICNACVASGKETVTQASKKHHLFNKRKLIFSRAMLSND